MKAKKILMGAVKNILLSGALLLCLVSTARAQAIVAMQPGLNRLKQSSSNGNLTVTVKVPSNASRVDFDFENTSSSTITYSLTFSASSFEQGQGTSGNLACSQSPYQGSTTGLPVAINTTFTSQTLGGFGGVLYSCPTPPSLAVTIAYTSTTPSTTLSVYAIAPSGAPGAQGVNSGTPGAVGPGLLDPCQDPTAQKQSVAISTSASVQLVAASGTKITYVCGWSFSLTGTTPTAQFAYGTGAVCATGQVNATGAMAPTAGAMVTDGPGSTIFSVANNTQNVCIIMGATSTANGILTFFQR